MGWEQWKSAAARRKSVLLLGSIVLTCLLVVAARTLDLSNPYLPFAISGAAIFYLRVTSSVHEKFFWIAASACFAAFVHFPKANWVTWTSSLLAVLGLGAFLLLALRVLWSATETRRQALAPLAPAVAVVFFVFSAQHALSFANLLHPKTYDIYLYVFDGSLGFQPSFIVGQVMRTSRLLAGAAILTYLSLPLFMALVYALRQPRDARVPSWDIISLLMLAGIGGCFFYNIVPATGPVFCFDFPLHPLPFHLLPRLQLEQIPVAGDIPRNAIPSLHVAWVLLLYWNTRTLSAGFRALAAVYMVLTIFATLGTGEHYLVDLVASMPFALLVQAIVSPDRLIPMRLRVMISFAGLALTFGWLFLVRYATKFMLISPAIPWTLMVSSCVIVLFLRNRLSASSEQVLKGETASTPIPAICTANDAGSH